MLTGAQYSVKEVLCPRSRLNSKWLLSLETSDSSASLASTSSSLNPDSSLCMDCLELFLENDGASLISSSFPSSSTMKDFPPMTSNCVAFVLFFSMICSCLHILFSLLRTDLARDLKLFTLSLSFSATLLTTESKVDLLGSITLNLEGIE